MKNLVISLKIFLFFSLLTGIVYPLVVTGIAQLFFSEKANGSMISTGNTIVGSSLIGQQFNSDIYFSSRPSAISFNPLPSGGSNYGLTNSKLISQVIERKTRFILFNKLDSLSQVPSEMLFASASGLDPHISPEAAQLQVNRIGRARNLNSTQLESLLKTINDLTEKPQLSILGEPRVNVLVLNLELDKRYKISH